MKLDTKQILLIFLIALLGSLIGTAGALGIAKVTGIYSTENSLTITAVNYEEPGINDYTASIDKAYDTVVEITSTIQTVNGFFGPSTSTGKGAGVIISEDGYIVTNDHVVSDANKVAVRLSNGTDYEAKVIGTDSRTDIALLKIDENKLKYSAFADSDELKMGQSVIAIGNPLGQGISCSNGIISVLSKEVYINNVYMDLIQTNAAVNEGNSGGGLFNLNGDLIGIVNAKKYSNSVTVEGMGFAIPSKTVIKVIGDLKQYGYVKQRATLGVRVYSNSNYYIYNNITGVQISEIIEGSSADKAGLMPKDIIKAIDGKEITSYADLSKILDKHQANDKVNLTIERDGNTQIVEVILQEAIG